MIFTPDSGGEQTVGIGQFRDVGLPTQQMEMQMLSSHGSLR